MARKPATAEKIGRVGQRRRIVIPQDILDTLNIREGDLVAFTQTSGGVLIKPKRKIDDGTQLTSEEAKLVRRGEAQLKRGASMPWRAVKHALSR
jgi:AbrB family looped-hinge helix DNA binding protein